MILNQAKAVLNLHPSVKQFFLSISFLSMIFELVKLVPPVVFKIILDHAVDPAMATSFAIVFPLIAAYGGSLFLTTLIEVIFTKIAEKRMRNVERSITLGTVEKLLALDVDYHQEHMMGTSMSRVLRGSWKIVDLFYHVMLTLFPAIFQTTFTLIVLFILSWQLGLVFLIFVPIFLFFLVRGAVLTQETRKIYHKNYEKFSGLATQAVANVRTVKDFDNEAFEGKRTKTIYDKYLTALLERIRIGLKNRTFEDGVISVARVLTLILAVQLMLNGTITAGSLVLVVTLSEKAFLNLARVYRVYYQMQDIEQDVHRFNNIHDAPINVQDKPSSKKKITKGTIEFAHVSFRYEENELDALRNVSFTIESRQTVAIVGRSGSGKSTMTKLLLRHFDPNDGTILVDGTSLSDYSFKNLRGSIAVVSQDVELFNDTIAANIAYGITASKKEILRVAKLAHAHEFISKFASGYDTLVGERGVKLSGGQKQRLAIARALLRKPKILIFDEATSSLDAESEKYIHDSIEKLQGKVTLLIIAHRFATIARADRIILLEEGEVKEIGTHDQLLKKKGIFAKLRKLQELGDVD
ncbi:MAG: ABC transporter ATP-binding protein [Candidatus Woesearchaeota archaeon]|nr:ABC transporter ATP-binding protein [Candidatus Woesearchaeota archaeon]